MKANVQSRWPVHTKIHSAYLLQYIRTDVIEQVLVPPSPSGQLMERLAKEDEMRNRQRQTQATTVLVSIILEQDLIMRQPCGYWDLQKELLDTKIP